MNHDIFTTRYTLGRVLSVGWEEYRKHFRSILFIFLIVYIPINVGLSFIPVETLIENYGVKGFRIYMKAIQLTEFFIGILATMALAKLIEEGLLGRTTTWQQALRHACSRWRAAVGTGFLSGLIILGLILLLIVPGVIWGLYYVFFLYAVTLRDVSGKKALDYSKALVKGQWWRVCGCLLVINIVGMLAAILTSAPFYFAPENQVLGIIADCLTDIVTALSLAMTIVFFLNNDLIRVGTAPPLPALPDLPDLQTGLPVSPREDVTPG